ncbi:hypothetical protein DF039_04090 [Burkholderia cenocepacia]|nr:hypothetical protein DF039_04090 [Burkholderia cenocepacia]
MSETKDFEAIGRYHDAFERVNALTVERHNLAGAISGLLQEATIITSSNTSVRKFNHDELAAKVDQLAGINLQLELAINEVNAAAQAAGKPAIKRI